MKGLKAKFCWSWCEGKSHPFSPLKFYLLVSKNVNKVDQLNDTEKQGDNCFLWVVSFSFFQRSWYSLQGDFSQAWPLEGSACLGSWGLGPTSAGCSRCQPQISLTCSSKWGSDQAFRPEIIDGFVLNAFPNQCINLGANLWKLNMVTKCCIKILLSVGGRFIAGLRSPQNNKEEFSFLFPHTLRVFLRVGGGMGN